MGENMSEPLRHGNERCEKCGGQHEEGTYCGTCALAAEIASGESFAENVREAVKI
jgi:ribosomal protein S27AE